MPTCGGKKRTGSSKGKGTASLWGGGWGGRRGGGGGGGVRHRRKEKSSMGDDRSSSGSKSSENGRHQKGGVGENHFARGGIFCPSQRGNEEPKQSLNERGGRVRKKTMAGKNGSRESPPSRDQKVGEIKKGSFSNYKNPRLIEGDRLPKSSGKRKREGPEGSKVPTGALMVMEVSRCEPEKHYEVGVS